MSTTKQQPSGGATLAPVQQCMDHGECFGGKCIYPTPQPAQVAEPRKQEPKAKAIAECLAVLRPTVRGKFPQEQALEELAGYVHPQAPATPLHGEPLTDEQIEMIWRYGPYSEGMLYEFNLFARAIEAKLKEKNSDI